MEGCADDEGLNSHGDLPHYSPSDSILEREVTESFNNSIVHLQHILLKYSSETSFRHQLSTTSFLPSCNDRTRQIRTDLC
jgi:hypothetical protein